MAISSNTLFHFTGTIDNLISIIKKSAFLPRYCIEYDKGRIEDGSYYAIPMVCFCDIPLSEISKHIKDYGSYGIGMSKQWAKEKVSPIIYYNHSNSLAKSLYEQISPSLNTLQRIKWFSLLKRYYGQTWSQSEGKYINKVLYNEREWRYFPRKGLTIKDALIKVKDIDDFFADNYGKGSIKDNANKNLSKYPLSFELKDIKYLFVKTDTERIELIKHIVSEFGDTDDSKVLCSKVLTVKQIKEDF